MCKLLKMLTSTIAVGMEGAYSAQCKHLTVYGLRRMIMKRMGWRLYIESVNEEKGAEYRWMKSNNNIHFFHKL